MRIIDYLENDDITKRAINTRLTYWTLLTRQVIATTTKYEE